MLNNSEKFIVTLRSALGISLEVFDLELGNVDHRLLHDIPAMMLSCLKGESQSYMPLSN